jgi:F-type H+-transporting ATPase subunit alpha
MRAMYNNCYVSLSVVESSSALVPSISDALKRLREEEAQSLRVTTQGDKNVYGEAVVQLLGQVRKTVHLGELEESGEVLSLGDGIARVSGLRNVMAGELVTVHAYAKTDITGGRVSEEYCQRLSALALNLEEDYVGVVLLTKVREGFYLAEGCEVLRSGRLAQVRVGYGLLGRVVDPLGAFLDGLGEVGPSFDGVVGASRDHLSRSCALQVTLGSSGAPTCMGRFSPARHPVYPSMEMVEKFSDTAIPLGQGISSQVGEESKQYWFNRPIEAPSPTIISRRGVCKALQTGVLAVDALIPIGRGQRELIIGDRKTGKTSLVLDTIRAQAVLVREGKDSVISVYVAIGQKASSVAAVRRTLMDEGLFRSLVFVVANADSLPSCLYIAPFSGTSVGEFFMGNGLDALVVYDDLSKHAAAYREISLLLRRPPGREAYPGDVFFVHARLLERAANLAAGGSLTALPVIETQEGDVSAYIPTNVISITDGQVFLSAKLFNAGVLPAIDVGISVSRVGSAAQVKSVKQLTARLKLVLAQLTELEAFSQFSSDLDKSVLQRLESFRRYRELFKQQGGLVYTVASEVLVLYIARLGGFDVVSLGFGFRRFMSVLRSIRLRTISPRLVEGAAEEVGNLIQLRERDQLTTGAMIASYAPGIQTERYRAGHERVGLTILEASVGLPKQTLSGDHMFVAQDQTKCYRKEDLALRAATLVTEDSWWRSLTSAAGSSGEKTGETQGGFWPHEKQIEISGSSVGLFLDRPFDYVMKSKCSAFGAPLYFYRVPEEVRMTGCGNFPGAVSETEGVQYEYLRDLSIGRYRSLDSRVETEMRGVYHIMVLLLVKVFRGEYGINFTNSSWFKAGYCRLILSKFVF